MVLVEPGSGHVTNLSNDIASNFLCKLKDWRLGSRIKQESKEVLVNTISIVSEEGVEVRARASKGEPVAAGV